MTASLPIDDLTRLLSEKPEVIEALKGAATPQAAAALLAGAARDGGIAIDPAALAAFYQEQVAASGSALSDDDLDRISAGGVVDSVFMSIFTLGIGCLVVSIQANNKPGKCGSALG
ncbi:hypothetical protein [Azospirillum thermophilum]|nr:hypothetical protein [Azospirillum thermophilum]